VNFSTNGVAKGKRETNTVPTVHMYIF
jgi:hypothetical protein